MSEQLWRLLRDHVPELRIAWANNLKGMSDTRYATRSFDDLLSFTTDCLAGYLALLEGDDPHLLRELITQDARIRLRTGFRLAEVQRAYAEFRNVVWPLVSQEFADDNAALLEAMHSIDSCVNNAVFEFSELYQTEMATRLDHYLAQIEASNQFLKDTAIRDSLTGSYSLIHFLDRFGEEVERAQRYQRSLSLLFIDIDHFDKINQDYGHLIGDVILVNLSRLLNDKTRASDLVARYGGEEFVIALPEADKSRAAQAGEKLRRAVASASLWDEGRMGAEVKVTVSMGLATYPDDGQSAEVLIEAAEQAMRRAKAMGRNLLELA